MDALGERDKIRVERTGYDSGVRLGAVMVKLKKMPPVVRQQYAGFIRRKRKDLGIRHGGVRPSGFPGGQNIMTQTTQFQNHLHGDILVAVEVSHFGLRGLIRTNLLLNFSGMGVCIIPGVDEIFGSQ